MSGGLGKRAVVLGYHTMGCLGFDALRRHGYEVAAVLTHPDDPREEIWWESLAAQAEAAGVPVHTPESSKGEDFRKVIASYDPDFLFSFYYRFMIPAEVLALAPRGALNLHGSLLPRYRGRAPVNWVLVEGETETGVSLHYMVAQPDAGDLVDQERVAIDPADTAFTLYGKLEAAATVLLDRALPALAADSADAADAAGAARRVPLDLSQGSYRGGRKPADGLIDWSWPARRIYDLVRGVTHPYPGAFTTLGGRRLLVWWSLPVETPRDAAPGTVPGTIISVDREGITVAAGDGAVRLITLQLAGQPELPAVSLALAAGLTAGARLGS
jgi:methionyl-tRNA formyltransferase